MQIREATTEDVIGIIYVQATTWIKQYPSDKFNISEADIRAIDWQGKIPGWQHMVRSSDYTVLVASEDKEIRGFGALNRTGKQIELYELDVLPEYQGRQIGGKLLRSLMAVSNGDVYLQVAVYNDNAIGFYEYHGFSKVGVRGAYELPGDKRIPTVQMCYRIAPTRKQVERVSRVELARRSGVRESTIKWYCEQGLLEFKQAEAGRRRYFNYQESSERLRRIGELKSQGRSLSEIKREIS